MRLFYSPGACALHPQMALREAGLHFDLVRVDLRTHQVVHDRSDFYSMNPKGYVPVLELDDGARLTEGAVIVQHVADLNPAGELIPPCGSMGRLRVQEWLHFLGTEIHEPLSLLFHARLLGADPELQRKRVGGRLEFIVADLGGRTYLHGNGFTVADGYLYNLLRWAPHTGIDLARWPTLHAYFERIDARPSVRASLEAERASSPVVHV
jgi:glutathione S-transferase